MPSAFEVLHLSDEASATFAVGVADLAARLRAAQAGTGTAVEVLEGTGRGTFLLESPTDVGRGIAAVIRTSGSTGMPKRTALPASALAASAASTRERLGGDGHWLLALPLHYVAGLAVVSRALLGGSRLATLDLTARFTPEAFAAATAVLRSAVGLGERLYTSLVPTQLGRLLEAPTAATLAALREYDALLIGGGRTPDATRASARAAGLNVVLTYGSAETCGGCVYDGRALPGVSVRAVDGRLRLGGGMVAAGYVADPERTADHFVTDPDGSRWYVTDDLGAVSPDGTLSVSGRIDDVINTGGVKVSAQEVQRILEGIPGVTEVFVAGVPHPEWVEVVAAAVAFAPQHAPTTSLSAFSDVAHRAIVDALGPAAAPKYYRDYATLPRLGNGKPDRRTLIAQLSELVG